MLKKTIAVLALTLGLAAPSLADDLTLGVTTTGVPFTECGGN